MATLLLIALCCGHGRVSQDALFIIYLILAIGIMELFVGGGYADRHKKP